MEQSCYTIYMSYDEGRLIREVGQAQGHPVTDPEVGFLARHNFLRDARENIEHGVDWAVVVREVARELKDGRHQQTAREVPPDQSADRAWALSVFYALEAAEDVSVQWFRENVLGGRLLSLEEVAPWVEARWHAEETMRFAQVPYPPGVEPQESTTPEDKVVLEPAPPATWSTDHGVGWLHRRLYYPSPDGTQNRSVPTGEGVLNDLRRVGERLTKRYGWQADAATVFVLTGMVPVTSTIRIEITQDMIDPERSRITLTVNPTMKPEQVAAVYAKERKELPGPLPAPRKEVHAATRVRGTGAGEGGNVGGSV